VERGADLPLTISCSSKIQIGFIFVVLAHLGRPGQHTHTHPFNGPLYGTTHVSRYQKGETKLDFTEARDSEWQLNPLGHMQVCTLLQTDSHTGTHHSVFYRPDALPATQPTASKH